MTAVVTSTLSCTESQPCTNPEITQGWGTVHSNRDSEIKARYALVLLRVAQLSDSQTAARLVQHLIKDGPHPDERREIAAHHLRAIEQFEQLALSLGDAKLRRRPPWKTARDAATRWLDLATGSPIDNVPDLSASAASAIAPAAATH